jgi:hypothetical protein
MHPRLAALAPMPFALPGEIPKCADLITHFRILIGQICQMRIFLSSLRPARIGIKPCTVYRPKGRLYKAKDCPLLWNGTTPFPRSPSCGLSVKERFGVCSKMSRASCVGEAPSAVSKEDTRRCASLRQSCYAYIVSCGLRSEKCHRTKLAISSLEWKAISTPRTTCPVPPPHPSLSLPTPSAHMFRVAAAALSRMAHSAFPSL